MNKNQRHYFILEQLQKQERVWVTELASCLEVTPETIRRDLAELEMNEKVSRVHGGAVAFSSGEKEMVYARKLSLHLEEKKQIARIAAGMIQDGDTIGVDVGTTTVHIADMLEDVHGLTIVTNSLSAANRFNLAIEEGRITAEVIMLPGVTNPYQLSVKGMYTVELLRRFNLNKSFLSCGGLTHEAVFDFDIEESLVSEMMMKRSREAVLLTDSSKLNKKSLFEIAPISNLSYIICDQEKPVDWQQNRYEWISVDPSSRKDGNHEGRLSYPS